MLNFCHVLKKNKERVKMPCKSKKALIPEGIQLQVVMTPWGNPLFRPTCFLNNSCHEKLQDFRPEKLNCSLKFNIPILIFATDLCQLKRESRRDSM